MVKESLNQVRLKRRKSFQRILDKAREFQNFDHSTDDFVLKSEVKEAILQELDNLRTEYINNKSHRDAADEEARIIARARVIALEIMEKRFPEDDAFPLTIRQEKFVNKYMETGSAEEACRYANLKTKRPDHVLNIKKIQDEVNKRRQVLIDRTMINAERTILEYARLAYSRLTDFYDSENGQIRVKSFEDLNDDQKASIQNLIIEESSDGKKKLVKIKLHDKVRALDSIAKHLGLFEKDNYQKKPNINVNVEDIINSLPPEISDTVRSRLAIEIKPDSEQLIN